MLVVGEDGVDDGDVREGCDVLAFGVFGDEA